MYRIRILDAVTRELAGLDKPIGHRIVQRIHWLAENLDEVDLEPLCELESRSATPRIMGKTWYTPP